MAKKLTKSQSSVLWRISPALRMVQNGDLKVNAERSEKCAYLAAATVPAVEPLPAGKVTRLQAVQAKNASISMQMMQLQSLDLAPAPPVPEVTAGTAPVPKSKPVMKTGKLAKPPQNFHASVFIRTRGDAAALKLNIPGRTAMRGNLIAARLKLTELEKIAGLKGVSYIENGQTLTAPVPKVGSANIPEPSATLRQIAELGEGGLHRNGRGVVVGIIDVGGFDFAHPDFLDARGKTRFEKIWDQGATGGNRPPPRGFDFKYGSEITRAHLDAAMNAAATAGMRASELEPQSSMSPGSHGTHVASIAAGNRGVAREAEIVGVLISIPQGEAGDRASFYDSARLVHAVEYLVKHARDQGKPLVINISLGTNGAAHDGSSPICRWIDALCVDPGTVVCVAAGNAGQDKAQNPGDLGYIMGRIHTKGRIPSRGLIHDIGWEVGGDGRVDVSENQLDLWFGAQDQLEVLIRPPGGEWIGPVGPRQFIQNRALPDGTRVSIYNELYHPANGSNRINILLSPQLGHGFIGIKAGTWTVRLRGLEVRDGSFHGWIERDDPSLWKFIGQQQLWRFPSYFSAESNVDEGSIGSLACGQRLIAVANLHEAVEKVNHTSSQGPTRDGRCKPDICAPGTDIPAANAFTGPDAPWINMTGTSMASPYVAGVAALMLAINPHLTAAQIESIMRNTASPLPGTDYQWKDDAGYGRIHPGKCLLEASLIETLTDITG